MEPLSSSRPQHDAAASRRRGGSGAGFELEVHEDSAPAGWDSAVRAQRGVVFHTEAWASHKTSGGDGEPVFCTWRDLVSGEVAARALAIRRPPRATRAGKLVSKLAFNSPPVGIGAGSDFVSPLERWARGRATLIQVTLGSFDATSEWAPTVLPHPQRRSEYVLPAGGEADVWENMRGRARRGVKQASKTGVECRAVVEPAALREFAEVYRTTNERLEMLKALPPSHLHVGRFVDSLTALLERDQGRVYAATQDAHIVAGTVFATFGDRAYLIYSGATDSGRDEGAPFLAMYTALRELRAEGFAFINLGGAAGDAAEEKSPDHGLHQFKMRFGANREERTSGTIVLRPLRAKLIQGAQRLVRR